MPTPLLSRVTPLHHALASGPPVTRVTAADAFELAVKKWSAGERLEIGPLAAELGISRATLFRWVGSRELFLGEVIWFLCEKLWKKARRQAKGTGADLIADTSYHIMLLILDAAPMRAFLSQDPEYALRILTSKTSAVQERIVQAVIRLLYEEIEAKRITLALPPEDMAYMMVRIVESCIYGDQIAGRSPEVRVAREAIRILAGAVPNKPAAEPSEGRRAA